MVFRGMGGAVGFGLALASFVGLVVAVGASQDGSAGPQQRLSLAERVNRACGRFELVDWSTGDAWDRVPPGTLRVTCLRGDGTLFFVAVAR